MMLLKTIERKEKNEAKKVLKDIQVVVEHWERMWKTAENIEKELSAIYSDLPESQRQDYVQKTMELLKYGFDIDTEYNGGGYIDIFKNIYIFCEGYQYRAKTLYNEKNYNGPIRILGEMREEIKKIKEKYGRRREGF